MRIRTFMKRVAVTTIIATAGFYSVLFSPASQAKAATSASIDLINTGKDLLGVPYRFGAPAGITYAFDCSSFTQYIFDTIGVSIPRTSIEQAKIGKKVKPGYLSVGDLVFYNTNGKGISHVAIYAGDGKILHSASKGVMISDMNSSYWKRKYVTARRVFQ